MINYLSSYIEIITLAVAIIAILISGFSIVYSRRAVLLAERQEKNTKPLLVPTLINGYYKVDNKTGDRTYAFFLSVSNRSDSDNSLTNLELCVSYLTVNDILMTVRLQFAEKQNSYFNISSDKFFSIPQPIDAHKTLTGWCFFKAKYELFHQTRIDEHTIEIKDSFETRSSVHPGLIQEYREEVNV